MKRKMNGLFKRMISLALVSLVLIAMPCTQVLAAEEIETVAADVMQLETILLDVSEIPNMIVPYSTAFSKASILTSFSSAGMLVEFAARVNGTASYIGVKDIVIQKKVWYGWETVATSQGSKSTNTTVYASSVLYPNAVKGETYRTKCLFYAYVDEYAEGASETTGYVCDY